MGFSPRKRAVKKVPRIKSWPSGDGSPALQGFVGCRAGMTHMMTVNDEADPSHERMEESVLVTVIEVPPMRTVALRAYEQTSHGMKPQAEVWAGEFRDELDRVLDLPVENMFDSDAGVLREAVRAGGADDLRVITHTVPSGLMNVPKKKPDVMGTRVGGSSMVECADFALSLVAEGSEHEMSDMFHTGEYLGAAGVTKGKGTQDPVERQGVQKRKGKRARQDWKYHIGNLGPWNPSRVRSMTSQLGQTGYHQRTGLNKRPIDFGEGGGASVEGGFVNYGEVGGLYTLIKGLLSGPNKRLLRFRLATRSNDQPCLDPEMRYVSTVSNQGQTMQVTIRDLNGDGTSGIDLPRIFETAYRPGLIECAVITVQANRKQLYGVDPYVRLRISAEPMGSSRGMSRDPCQNGVARRVSRAVSGRRAHPPKAEKDQEGEINTRERKLVVRPVFVAMTDPELVAKRGHRSDDGVELPFVISDDSEDLVKAQEVVDLLQLLGVSDDIERSEENKEIKNGQDKLRGRKYIRPKSILLATADEPSKAACNPAGIDVATVASVSAEDLVPSIHTDRPMLSTGSALEEVAK